jgi:hypothetical protein
VSGLMLKSKVGTGCCRAFGIDPLQYRLLLDLFSMLGDRLEFMGTTVHLNKVIGFFVFFSLLLSLIAFTGAPLHGYQLIVLLSTMVFIFMMLTQDIANSVMNPDEASVLAPIPIGGATYIAAKLTHVLVIVAVITLALNAIPAVAGLHLQESRWFYPLTHLLAAYAAGMFVAFVICGFYGWLFLFISPAKVKNALMWLQFLTLLIPALIVNILRLAGATWFGERIQIFSKVLGSSWMPWRWFVALGLVGHTEYPAFSAWNAIAAFLLASVLIASGLRGFRADYLIKVSSLIQGSGTSAARSGSVSLLSPLARKLTGAPSGCGAFSWVSLMCRRDWNFRIQGLWNISTCLVFLVLLIIAGTRVSPDTSMGFSPMHGLPHLLGMTLAVVCCLIPYTAEPHGASVFGYLPLGSLQSFVRGIYLSLWMPVGIVHFGLLFICMWFWGVKEGLLFVFFSVSLTSVYLAIAVSFIDGFPFANAFKASAGKELSMVFLIMLIPVLPLFVLQWLVFHNPMLVLGASIASAFLAFAGARFALGRLEKRIQVNLRHVGLPPQQMFKELE